MFSHPFSTALASHLANRFSSELASWIPTITLTLGVRTITVLAAGSYAYAGLWPESQIFGPCVVASNRPTEVALTYDDGPADPDTFHLLDVLAKHGVRATFFMIGQFVQRRPEIARAVAAAGHLIGNHTMTHPLLLTRSPRIVRQQLLDCNAALE
ncbi:MAG: polysaccharide deacetylase family protein, partial [Acidobacteriaceae bacterium]